jgi:hypothetical protein
MTPHEKAVHFLRKAMIAHRDTAPAAVRRYIAEHLSPGARVTAQDLPVGSVPDAVSYLVLMRLAGISSRNPAAVRRNPLLRSLGFEVSLIAGSRADTHYFNVPNFQVTWRDRDAT